MTVGINRSKLKLGLRKFRQARKTKDELEKGIKNEQPTLISWLKEADPENMGFVYDQDGKQEDGKNAAFVQQNDAPEFWDTEAIIDYLNQESNKRLKKGCTSRVLDMKKFEAEVAAGNVPKSVASRFRKKGTAPAPFIRFGKPAENSK